MRRSFLRLSAISLGLVCASFSAPLWAADPYVAVTAIVEHPSLDAIRDGIKDELEASGYVNGQGFRWSYQSAQGNNATAAQIAKKFVGDRPNVIVAISTPSAQAVVASTKDIPVVYSAVTDPVAARLVKNMQASGTNITGVSDVTPVSKHVELMRQIVPKAKRIGVIYNPGEANSVVLVSLLKKAAEEQSLTVLEAVAPRTVDVPAAAQSLVGKVDVVYIPTDNNVVSSLEGVIKVAQQAKLPVISADAASVKRGTVAALGPNQYDIGRQTGKMVVRILRGESPGSIPSEVSEKLELHVNAQAAQKQGVTLPAELLKAAKVVY